MKAHAHTITQKHMHACTHAHMHAHAHAHARTHVHTHTQPGLLELNQLAEVQPKIVKLPQWHERQYYGTLLWHSAVARHYKYALQHIAQCCIQDCGHGTAYGTAVLRYSQQYSTAVHHGSRHGAQHCRHSNAARCTR